LAKSATAKKPGTDVAVSRGHNVPAHLKAKIAADAGKGISESADDSLVPLLVVLQAQSPQSMKQKPEYLKGAEAGCLWMKNAPQPVVKSEVGVLAQPVSFYKNVVEWIPKNKDGSGGGYVGEHKTMPADAKEVVDRDDPERKRMMSPRGTEYVETRNHVVILYTEDGQAFPYLIPLSSSGHSVSRQWMFMMKSKVVEGNKVPSFAVLYRLKTILRTKGAHNWYVIDPHEGSDDGTVLWASDEQYEAGKTLHEAFATGAKSADMSQMQDDTVLAAAKVDTKKAGKSI
jgi:hypothetical protein